MSQAFEALKEYMIANYNAKLASGGKEIVKRCHFCGDSRDLSSAHLYIGCKPNGAIVYNCFKCEASGYVDGKFLRNLGCYDPNIISLCKDQIKSSESSRIYNNYNFLTNSKNNIPIIPLSDDDFAKKKLEYISRRMGHTFTTTDASRFKIILNLKDYLNINGITKYTRNEEFVDLINKFFVGFLSMDNRYVILRRLVPEGKLPKYIDYRYLNYDIYGNSIGTKYYTIPTAICPTLPIDIHIAEGGFDILSIYLHVAPLGGNAIYSAVCGKSYRSLVRFLITTYGFTSFNLHIYPDADIKMDKMMMIKEDIRPFGAQVYIHRNVITGQKDYGVSMDLIKDSITKI